MKRSHFGESVLYHMRKHDLTQVGLATKAGVAQSSLSQLISQPKRPEEPTLKALCTCWPGEETNIRVLIEHLRDEMVRAGHSANGEVEFRRCTPAQGELDAALKVVADEAALSADVASLILDLALLLRRAQDSKSRDYSPNVSKRLHAAESKDHTYTIKRGGKAKP